MKRKVLIPLTMVLVFLTLVFMTATTSKATLYAIGHAAVSGDSNMLITIDPLTGDVTAVGAISDTAPMGLGTYDGRLFMYSQSTTNILELDPSTAATIATFDVSLPYLAEGALAFRSDGAGFITSQPSTGSYADASAPNLWQFSLASSASKVGSTGSSVLDGLAFSSSDTLIGLSQTDEHLYTVNQSDASLTPITSTTIPTSDVGDLAFDAGILYASTGFNLYSLDQATGNATLIGDISAYGSIWGLTAIGGEGDGEGDGEVSVPEPTTMLLLGFGLIGLVGLRRKFRKG